MELLFLINLFSGYEGSLSKGIKRWFKAQPNMGSEQTVYIMGK